MEHQAGPEIGIDLVRNLDPLLMPPSAQAAYHAPYVGEALHRLARYKALCSGENLRITGKNDLYCLAPVWHAGTTPAALAVATFTTICELVRYGTGLMLKPQHVTLTCPENIHVSAYFDCPITWSASQSTITFSGEDWKLPFTAYNWEIAEILAQNLESKLAPDQSTYAAAVRVLVEQMLPSGTPKLKDIARKMALSERTLQRYLVRENVRYQDLLAQVRYEKAQEYLTHTDMDYHEIAYLLGYDETGSFMRFFKQHSSVLPREWR